MSLSQTKVHPAIAAEDRLTALLDAAVDAIVLIDPAGNVTRFNRAAELLFGYSSAEVLGRNVNMLMPEPYHVEHDGYLGNYLKTGRARIIGIDREVVARRKDGSVVPIELSVGEFRRGGEQGFVGILRDISDRKSQEEKLRRSEEQMRLVFDNAPTAFKITTPTGQIISANRALSKLLGYTLDEFRRFRQSDLLHPEDRAVAIEQLRRMVEGDGEGACTFEVRHRRKDRSVVDTLVYNAVARDGDGRALLIISEIIDRSAVHAKEREAQDLRGQLAHVARLGTLGEMVSGIAHEVNQPLTAIANYANACRRLVESGRAQPAELVAALDKIGAQAERAGQVIRGLRNLVKRRDQVREPLDCNQLVQEVTRLVDFEFRQAGFRLIVRLTDALPRVMGDGVQVQQVVLNLVRNALEAMLEGARDDFVEVVTSTREGYVEIRVTDCGPGLSAAVADKLFEPFFTTKRDGFGLGLSICQSIASAHGGALTHTVNETGGATFTIRLPAQES